MSLRPRGSYGSPWPYHAIIAGQPVMLARDPNGAPSWVETKVKYFDQNALITAVDRNYQMFPPEFEFPYAQEDWGGGAGHADQRTDTRDQYWYADGVDASSGRPVRGPEVTSGSSGISAQINYIIEFNAKVYAMAGTRIYRRNDDVSAWTNLTPGTDFAGTVGRPVVFQGTQSAAYLFIPIGSGAHYYVMDTSETFTQHASQNAEHFETVGNELWLSNTESGIRLIRKAEDGGTAATWGAATTVGDAADGITDLRCVSDRLLVPKTRGVYGVSADAFTIDEDLTPELKGLKESTAGAKSAIWNGSLIFRMQRNLYRYDPDTGQLAQIGPELIDRNTSPVKGYVSAVDGQAGLALWATIYNATTGHSYLARYGSWTTTSSGQVFRPVWHYSLYKFTSKQVTCLFVSTGSYLGTPQPRLYAGCSDGTIYYTVLATTASVVDDPAYRFDTTAGGGAIYPSRYNAMFPFEDKLIKAVGVGGRQLSGTSQQIVAEYKAPSDSSYTSLGAVQADPGDRINVTGNVAQKAVDFGLVLSTTSNTTTPILTHFVVYAALRTTNLKQIDATIVASDGTADLDGKPMRYSWRDIRANLESAMITNGSFTITNPAGEQITVIGIDFGHDYAPGNDTMKRTEVWTERIRVIQTQALASRGTWGRAASFTWASLSAFRWSDAAVL